MDITTRDDLIPERLLSLDIIRGCAVLGILIVNIAGFALPFDAMSNPTIAGVNSRADYYAWYFTDLFITDSMRGLFAMLFGASLILITNKAEQKSGKRLARTYFFRRNGFLLLFGIIHSYFLLMAGDVLFPYAVAGFILYFIKDFRARNLLLLFFLILVLQTLINHISYISLLEFRDIAQSKGGEWLNLYQALVDEQTSSTAKIAEETNAIKGSYIANFIFIADDIIFLQTYYFITTFFWDVASMMILGMALYKLGILQGRNSRLMHALLVVGGYTIGIYFNYGGIALQESQNFNFLSQQQAAITEYISRAALTMGHLGLLHLFINLNILSALKSALGAVGRMALSNYIMQTIICSFIFYGFGFSFFGEFGRAELLGIMVVIWISQLILSPLWLSRYQFGLLEWVWRCLTIKEKIPLKKPITGH